VDRVNTKRNGRKKKQKIFIGKKGGHAASGIGKKTQKLNTQDKVGKGVAAFRGLVQAYRENQRNSMEGGGKNFVCESERKKETLQSQRKVNSTHLSAKGEQFFVPQPKNG